jgi:hypothetical protein
MEAVSQSTISKRPRIQPAVYSLNDFAALLGRSYTATHEAARAGTLPVKGFKIGHVWRFPKAEVDRLLGRGDTGVGEPV